MKKIILWSALAVVLVAGAGVGGYLLGVEDGKAQTNDVSERFMAERFGGGTGQTGQPDLSGQGQLQFPQGGQQGGGAFTGIGGRAGAIATIKEIQGNTLIVSTAERELKVIVSTDTLITMTNEGSISDFQVGDRITIGGQTEGDTMTATQIAIVSNIP